MNPTPRNAALVLLTIAISQNAVAAAQPAPKAEADEVLVLGERVKLDEMRKEIVRLEDSFYERYNEMNTVDDFDIHCVKEARTGTRLIRRSCLPVYQERAMTEEGQGALKMMQRFREKGPTVIDGMPPVPAASTIVRRQLEYKNNVKEVARKDAQLKRLLEERGKLIERYEATRRRIFGDNPPAEDGDAAAPVMP
jgi:hypothetical protein